MKQFLMTFFSAALVLGTSFESQAEQIWVNGVTSESGWSDFDKSRSDNNDDLLCWAASASCVLDYWQSLYITSSYIPTGEDIWQCFKDSSSDQVGNPVLAIQWWICGDYSGSSDRAAISISATSVPLETDFSQFGGYYWDVIPDTNGNKVVHLDNFLYTYFSTGKNEAAAVVNRLQYAPISLGIRSEYGMMHAITLWGLEYEINSNGESEITSMWITDSDDYTNQLRELSS